MLCGVDAPEMMRVVPCSCCVKGAVPWLNQAAGRQFSYAPDQRRMRYRQRVCIEQDVSMRHPTKSLVATLMFSLMLSACADGASPWVELKGQRYDVEVAMDDDSRVRGLMFRDQMADSHGMLFVFEQQQPLAFWMRNTRIPLDILYFDESLKLISVAAGVPPCTTQQCPSYPSKGPGRFVLELNAGQAHKLGAQVGDELELAPALRARIQSLPDDSPHGTQ